MIFPLLRGLLWFHRAPITWLIVAVNVGIFLITFPSFMVADQAIDSVIENEKFLETNGALFAALADRDLEPESIRYLRDKSLRGVPEASQILGSIALRRSDFSEKIGRQMASLPAVGDAVAIEQWKKSFLRLQEIQKVHPSYRFGIFAGHSGPLQWLTYQVTHSGFFHLFWNMVFLLLFGTFIEVTRGSKATFLALWLGGVGGALSYVLVSGLSASPMVGASAAVSSLIAMAASDTSRRLPFVYWLLPMKGYYGVAWLPAWVLLPSFVLPDLSGWVSSQPGLGGIAYTAHLGGALVGFALSFFFKPDPKAYDELRSGVTGIAASANRF